MPVDEEGVNNFFQKMGTKSNLLFAVELQSQLNDSNIL